MYRAIVIRLSPKEERPAPPFLGYAIKGWLLKIIQLINPTLADELHAPSRVQPYTISPLIGGGRLTPTAHWLERDAPAWIRITSLHPTLSDVLAERLPDILAAIDEVELVEGNRFNIDAIALTAADNPWAGMVEPQHLADQSNDATDPLTLNFLSPFSTKSDMFKAVPFPHPELVFGSLADRWNASFPDYPVDDDTRTRAGDKVTIVNYDDLRAAPVTLNPRHNVTVMGVSGMVTYGINQMSATQRATFRRLARFAFFAGAGRKTAWGLGQLAAWDLERERPLT